MLEINKLATQSGHKSVGQILTAYRKDSLTALSKPGQKSEQGVTPSTKDIANRKAFSRSVARQG